MGTVLVLIAIVAFACLVIFELCTSDENRAFNGFVLAVTFQNIYDVAVKLAGT